MSAKVESTANKKQSNAKKGGDAPKKLSASATMKKATLARKALLAGSSSHIKTKQRTSVSFHRPNTLKLARKPKYPTTSVHHAPRTDKFSTVISPLNTESAMRQIELFNTLVFIVKLTCNKRHVKSAVEQLYNVKVVKVNTLITPEGRKKAYVKISPDMDALDVANKIGFI